MKQYIDKIQIRERVKVKLVHSIQTMIIDDHIWGNRAGVT